MITYNNMITAIEFRDSLIEDIVGVVGFNPLYNKLHIPPADYSLKHLLKTAPDIGLDEVKKLKASILDGYRMNVMLLTDIGYKACGIRVDKPDALYGKPKIVVFSNMMIMNMRGEFKANFSEFSVMDGFVEWDPTFA